MKSDELVNKLQQLAPAITNVTATSDMGYEFSAVVPDGVIYAEPGMLLDYSGGKWPPDEWGDISQTDYTKRLRDFLLDSRWTVVAWGELTHDELERWLEAVNKAEC